MESSQPFISESESSCLNESLLIRNGEVRGNRVQGEEDKKQEIVIRTWLLEKYPQLFDQTIKIFQLRSSNQELKEKASRYQEIKGRLHEQDHLQSENLQQSSQIKENQEKINIFEQHKKLKDQIKQIHKEREEQMQKLFEMDIQKLGNRLKIKLLVKIVKDAMENQQTNPYTKIDEQYKQQLDHILTKYNESQMPQLELQSQEPSNEQQQIEKHQQVRRDRIKQQIAKLQDQKEYFLKMTQKQQLMTQNLKQEIKKSQTNQSIILGQIDFTGDISLKREILYDCAEKFINIKMENKDFNHDLGKSIEQYLEEIINLENQSMTLKKELQSLSIINGEKQNVCILLEKRLTELQKQSKLSMESLSKQNQINDSPHSILINNEEKILKAYMFEGNKMQSEISQMEHKNQKKEVDMFLEEQNKAYLECNQKVAVKKKSVGFITKAFPITLNLVIIIWILALVFFFTQPFLPSYSDYFFESSPMKSPRTVVHRYQGKARIVDGQVVNISHFDESSLNGQHKQMTMKESKMQLSQFETIVVEPLPEYPKKTWVDLLIMEYK